MNAAQTGFVVLGILAVFVVGAWLVLRLARRRRVRLQFQHAKFEALGMLCRRVGAEITPHARLVAYQMQMGKSIDDAITSVAGGVLSFGYACTAYQMTEEGRVPCGLYLCHDSPHIGYLDNPRAVWLEATRYDAREYGFGWVLEHGGALLSGCFPHGMPTHVRQSLEQADRRRRL